MSLVQGTPGRNTLAHSEALRDAGVAVCGEEVLVVAQKKKCNPIIGDYELRPCAKCGGMNFTPHVMVPHLGRNNEPTPHVQCKDCGTVQYLCWSGVGWERNAYCGSPKEHFLERM